MTTVWRRHALLLAWESGANLNTTEEDRWSVHPEVEEKAEKGCWAEPAVTDLCWRNPHWAASTSPALITFTPSDLWPLPISWPRPSSRLMEVALVLAGLPVLAAWLHSVRQLEVCKEGGQLGDIQNGTLGRSLTSLGILVCDGGLVAAGGFGYLPWLCWEPRKEPPLPSAPFLTAVSSSPFPSSDVCTCSTPCLFSFLEQVCSPWTGSCGPLPSRGPSSLSP